MLGHPKYTYKQRVRFVCCNKELVGRIEIVDSYGTWGQNEEPSYDIYVEANNTLYKHIRESWTLGLDESDDFKINKVNSKEEFKKVSTFFSNKWGVPIEAYLDSMEKSLTSTSGVPVWFFVEANNKIIAGLGIIENDFHKRKDLTPNICALYVIEEYRKMGISRHLLNTACSYLKEHKINDVYLITSHTNYYEKNNFKFVGEIEEDSGDLIRCYHRECK